MMVSLSQQVDELWILQGNPLQPPFHLSSGGKGIFWLHVRVTAGDSVPSPLLTMEDSSGLCISWAPASSTMTVASYRHGQLERESRATGTEMTIELSCAGLGTIKLLVLGKDFASPVQTRLQGDLELRIYCQGTAAKSDSYCFFSGPIEIWRRSERLAFDEGFRPTLLRLPGSMLFWDPTDTLPEESGSATRAPNRRHTSFRPAPILEAAIYFVQGYLDRLIIRKRKDFLIEIDSQKSCQVWTVVVLALALQSKTPKYRFSAKHEKDIHWLRLMQNLALPLAKAGDYDGACILKESDFQSLFVKVPEDLKIAIMDLGLVPSTLAQQALETERAQKSHAPQEC